MYWSWASWLARPRAPSHPPLPPAQGLPGGRRFKRAFASAIAFVASLWGTDDLEPSALEEEWEPNRIGGFLVYIKRERRYGMAFTDAYYDWVAASSADLWASEDGGSAQASTASDSDDAGDVGLSYATFMLSMEDRSVHSDSDDGFNDFVV